MKLSEILRMAATKLSPRGRDNNTSRIWICHAVGEVGKELGLGKWLLEDYVYDTIIEPMHDPIVYGEAKGSSDIFGGFSLVTSSRGVGLDVVFTPTQMNHRFDFLMLLASMLEDNDVSIDKHMLVVHSQRRSHGYV